MDLKQHLVPNSCHGQVHLKVDKVWSPIQPAFEHFQGLDIHRFSPGGWKRAWLCFLCILPLNCHHCWPRFSILHKSEALSLCPDHGQHTASSMQSWNQSRSGGEIGKETMLDRASCFPASRDCNRYTQPALVHHERWSWAGGSWPTSASHLSFIVPVGLTWAKRDLLF